MARIYKLNEIGKMYQDVEKTVVKGMADDVARNAYNCMKKHIISLYNAYSPQQYKRTYELLNALTVSPVQNKNGTFSIRIYIPNENRGHTTILGWEKRGLKAGDDVSVSDVMEWLEEGWTWGREESSVMDSTYEEMKATNMILKSLMGYMKSKGYNLV